MSVLVIIIIAGVGIGVVIYKSNTPEAKKKRADAEKKRYDARIEQEMKKRAEKVDTNIWRRNEYMDEVTDKWANDLYDSMNR